ncbi:MAG: phenylalanine--tRNA ligase subunit beta [Candidatus Saccharibacteria bacterium]|nr:phenylalanine--tRNA ligase subunit beta [Candidatus Saccharibacteria bacterium]
MLISLNWLKGGLQTDNISDEELVKLIGARLVEVEGVIDQTHKYDKIYVVEVKYCEAIEGTHLHLCKIDDGGVASDVERDENGYVQVMCGAPNVHEGMFAVWIAPGAIVPQTYNTDEPFEISMRKMLKKYDSYGMMAGADELDLGDDHSGIVEINPALAKPGKTLSETFGNLNDKILDIENKSLTHRPDTFGILGFRREVAGILGQKHTTDTWYTAPEQLFENDSSVELDIQIDENLCPRYTAIVFEATEPNVNPYLDFDATLLARSGMRAVSPIVDATNIIMLATGQPLHAFDYDKFVAVGGSKTPKIIVRAAKKGEKLELLDGTVAELDENDIVITSNDIPVALAGAMGSASTAIDENTKRVILESATFSLYNLRKTQMKHGIFSEAITRFTKGQPAGQTKAVAIRFAEKASKYLKPLALFDTQKTEPAPIEVSVSLDQINGLLGSDFSADEVKTILENVEFKVSCDDNVVNVIIPFWRTDIHIAEDIIEEVGRLSGFDNIAPVLPLHGTSTPNEMFALKSQIRNHFSARGANEVLTYSFVHGDLMQKVGQKPENSYKIINSISPELQHIRQSIVPSLLDKSYANLRAGHDQFALFEMNQVYPRNLGVDNQQVPQGSHELGFVFATQKEQSNYYIAKKYLESLLSSLNISFEIVEFESNETNSYYEPKRSATIKSGDVVLGYIGEIQRKVLRGFKLTNGTAAFELSMAKLLSAKGEVNSKDFRTSDYPAVLRDITLTVASDAKYDAIEAQLRAVLDGFIYKLAPTSIYQAEGSATKNLSFHIEFAAPDKTLTKAEISDIMKKLEAVK